MEKLSNKKVSLVTGAAALTLLLLLTVACGSPGDTSEPPAFPSVTKAPATLMSASQRDRPQRKYSSARGHLTRQM